MASQVKNLSPEQWSLVRSELEKVLSVRSGEREACLADLAGRSHFLHAAVLELLAAENTSDRLFDVDNWRRCAERRAVHEGTVIGRYRILREIGFGGMGAVYLAERADREFEQRVALKLLRNALPGESAIQRFRRERQILAQLEHPGIARLLDGGVTVNGEPYAVMEYVDGIPIDEFCERRRLSVRERLSLFLRVAEAVEFAHRNLILHLDLKPANILVTNAGDTRLLDFGISRILNESQTAELTTPLVTLQYASPEQMNGLAATTASDEFSLATVLYKLLTGALPYPLQGLSPFEAVRCIAEADPRLPSQTAPEDRRAELRGDLDLILLQALRKEPERRYGSVGEFARDIRRYLSSEPVLAHAYSVGYRFGKLIQRNRGYTAVAVAALAIALVSMGLVLRYAVLARQAQQVAEKRLGDVRDLAHTFIFDVDPELNGIPGTVRARSIILKTGLKYLDAMATAAGNDDKLKMDLALGYAQMSREQYSFLQQSEGDPSGARLSQNKALTLAEDVFRRHPADAETLRDFLSVARQNTEAADEAGGDIPAYDDQIRRLWQLGQPLLAGNSTPRGLLMMCALSGELATNRTGNGGMWSLGDPRGGIAWATTSLNLSGRVLRDFPGDRAAIAAAVDGIYAVLTLADSYSYLGDEAGVRKAFAELDRRALDPHLADPRLASQRHVIHDYQFSLALLLHDLERARTLMPEMTARDRPESGDNRRLDQESALQIGYRAMLELAEGKQAGVEDARRAFAAMDGLERTTHSDAGPRVQLVWLANKFGAEPLLPAVDRRQYLERALEIAEEYAPRHPRAASAEIRIAQLRLLLGRIARSEDRTEEAAGHLGAAREALVIARKNLKDRTQVEIVESQIEAEASGRLDGSEACVQTFGAAYFYTFLDGSRQIAACGTKFNERSARGPATTVPTPSRDAP